MTPTTLSPAAQVISSASNPFDLNPFNNQHAAGPSTGSILGVTPVKKDLPCLLVILTPQDEEWSCLDTSAAAHITLNIKNITIRAKFRHDATAAEIWSSLCTHFERTNGFLALQAHHCLNSCRYTNGHDLQLHLDNMTQLWQNALAVGVGIPDGEYCHILRSSFPPNWALLITTLIMVTNPVILESSLLAYADIWGQSGHSSRPALPTSSTALMSSTIVCTNCGKGNHTFEKCYRKGGGAEHPAPPWWRTRQQASQSQGQPKAKIATIDTTSLCPADSHTHDIVAFTTTHA